MSLDVGHSLRGYQIREFIQEGGFGSIYRAHQDSINRDVAIKSIDDQEIVKNIDFIRRFEIEAQIVARLEHPHIVPIYDFWREPDSAFIVMRWLDGGSIRTHYANRAIDLKTLSSLISQIGSALDFIHKRNIIHRDIKPDNILVDSANNFYLTDFGIAIDSQHKWIHDPEFMRLGTPEYIPPELILNDEISFKNDIYAFAIAIYEILTGTPPFTGDNMDEILSKHVHALFPSIAKYRPDLSTSLDSPLFRATAKEPEERYDSILEFVNEFLSVLDDHVLSVTAATFQATPISTQPLGTQPVNTIELDKPAVKDTLPIERPTIDISKPADITARNPYKGLQAFNELDADDFYGRTAIIQQMLSLLQQQKQNRQPSFLSVIGASGSGKSSIVRAGLIPQLRSGGLNKSDEWFYITMIPGKNPLETLAEKLNSIAIQGQPDLEHILRTDPENADDVIAMMVEDTPIFLLIDQFEEVFTQVSDPQEQSAFIDLLVKLIHSSLTITITLTLRADFYDKPLAHRELGELIQLSTVTILPMSSDELEQVIIKPAESVNKDVQLSLVSQLIADTLNQPNALPLLQFTITELYEQLEGNTMTLEAYVNMGRLQGSVAQRAETVYQSLTKSQQQIAQRLFLQLVILSENNETVRRRILWEDTFQIAPRETIEPIINAFGDNRLLTFDREPISRQPTIEVAHEALLQAWTRLQIWIAENRNILTLYHRLTIIVRDWLDNKKDKSFLARDVQLLQYEEILNSQILTLNVDEREYIESSQKLRRRNQLLRYSAVIALLVSTVASLGVSIIAIDQQNQANLARQVAIGERDRANRETNRSQSQALSATALNSRQQGQIALLLSAQAYTLADTFEARDSLANILADNQQIETYLSQSTPIRDIALTNNGQIAYTVGDSNQITRWNLNTLTGDTPLVAENLQVINTIQVHPFQTFIAVGGDNGVTIFDTDTGEIINTLSRQGEVWSIIWSPTKPILYAVDREGTTFAYNVIDDEYLFDEQTSDAALLALDFNPDEDILMTGGEDNKLYGVDATTGETLYEFEGHSNWVLSLAFNTDGTLLASTGADLSLIVWDMVNLQALGQIPTRHTDWIRKVTFNSDSSHMMTVSADGTIQQWDVATGRRIGAPFVRHNSPIWSAHYLDEKRIISTDREGQLIIWQTTTSGYPLLQSDQIDREIIEALKIDNTLAIITQDNREAGALELFDLQSNQFTEAVDLTGFVTAMTYTANSNQLAIAGIDQRITLTNPSDITQQSLLIGHGSIILDLAFSPDGNTLLSLDEQGQIIRWDIDTQEIIEEATIPSVTNINLITYLDSQRLLTVDRTGKLRIHDAETLDIEQVIPQGHDGVVTQILFTNDNRTLYTVGRDGIIIEWDTATWENPTIFPHIHTDWILDITLIDDGILATTGRDSTVILWDTERRQPIGQPLKTSSNDWGVALAFDGETHQLYSFYRDGTMAQWDISLNHWLNHACKVANVTRVPVTINHLITGEFACIDTVS